MYLNTIAVCKQKIYIFSKVLLIFIILYFSANCVYAQTVIKEKIVVNNDTIEYVSTKTVHYLDGVIVPEKVAIEKLIKDEIDGSGFSEPRQAIRYYGERYRNGIILWESKNIKENEGD